MFPFQYLVIPRCLETSFCEEIIKLGDEMELRTATTDGGPDSHMSHVRNSKVGWFNEENTHTPEDKKLMEEVYYNMDSILSNALEDNNLSHINIRERQPFQYTNYRKGQYYEWHRDSREDPYEVSEYTNLIRKLSMTVLLNDPQDYEGGNFQLETQWVNGPQESWDRIVTFDPWNYDIGQGTVILFWAHMYHRVMPVRKGIRKSLVCWYLGDPWI